MAEELKKKLEEDTVNSVLAEGKQGKKHSYKEADEVKTKDDDDDNDDKELDSNGDEVDTDDMKEAYQDRDQPETETKDSSEKAVPGSKTGKGKDEQYIEGEDTDSVAPTGDSKKYTKDTAKVAKESVEQMFDGAESLSEEFVGKATTIFEAAFNEKVKEVAKRIEEEKQAEFDEKYANLEEEISERINEYLDYVVKEWLEENKIEVQKSVKSEIAEDFLTDLKDLFEQHNISIPDEKIDLLEEAQSENDELKNKVNELTEKVMEKNKTIFEHEKADVIESLSEGLAETQAERFKSLLEDVDANNVDSFEEKAKTIRKSFFKESNNESDDDETGELISEEVNGDEKEVNKSFSSVSKYVEAAKQYRNRNY